MGEKYIPLYWKHPITVLIPESNMNVTIPRAYRPILLINQDAKIMNCLLQNTLKRIKAVPYLGDRWWISPGLY